MDLCVGPHGASLFVSSRVMEDAQHVNVHVSPGVEIKTKKGGSVLEVLDGIIKGLGSKAKKDWIKSLNNLHKVTFLSIQETKMDSISEMDIKAIWGNYRFEYDHHILSDNFVALYGTWIPKQEKVLLISIYAPQSITGKRMLWDYVSSLVCRWNGLCMVMGDFNEVRRREDRPGSIFNVQGANEFNCFIFNSDLFEIQLEGFAFTWSHPSSKKMSKLDRFFVTDGMLSTFPHLSGVCVDLHLSDHRHILLREVFTDYGSSSFRFYHSWFSLAGFDQMVFETWNNIVLDDRNVMIWFKKKLQILKKEIRTWISGYKKNHVDRIDVDEPGRVKEEFRSHFASRFQTPTSNRCRLNFTFPKCLDSVQAGELESPVSIEEVRKAVWGCGDNKSPGPDGSTFEFFRKYWDILGSDFYDVVVWFFDSCAFARGCNASFITLIPKTYDPKFVSDYRPISLNGCLYKVITKILANRLSLVIPDLISDVQSAFLPNRQILDSPFIINELFIMDILTGFGFGPKWCSWIRGCLQSATASVLLNGSPTSEFQFQCGLKQGDPLSPFLFILVMETLHLSLVRAIDTGIFKGLNIGMSFIISHLFYADDAVFIGEWSNANLSGITKILQCFSLLSGLKINLKKSHLLVVGLPSEAWDDTISKVKARLSIWKLKALSVGGRFTLLRSVLGSTPIYNMSIYKVPNSVLHMLESIRMNFFNGVHYDERKITWVKWSKVLASKKYDGLGVSSFYALNRALLFKWVWRYISGDSSLWCRFIKAMHGITLSKTSKFRFSNWITIVREVFRIKDCGVDLLSHCHLRVGNGLRGAEASQLDLLQESIQNVILSNMDDRWAWDLNGEGVFGVKDVRFRLDEFFLPKAAIATRWVKYIPIKVNIFVWKIFLDRLPTRDNMLLVPNALCPICSSAK
nr:RNA-directed DNA polymerase, eukaryota [Tanacetum cinerariifolium]